ncbi:MAG: hypothetical protein P8X58_11995 [Syntrophobacterales bacterium]
MNPDKLPVQLPPEPESPKGFKALLQHHRFILATLVVLLFLGILFGLGLYRKAKTGTPGDITKLETAKPSKPLQSEAPEPLSPPTSEAPAATEPEHGTVRLPEPPETQVSDAAPPAKTPMPSHEAHPAEPSPAVKEHAAPAPGPAPHQAPPAEKIKGVIFTQALVKIMDDQVNKPLFGWRPNTIIFGKLGLTDNVNNLLLKNTGSPPLRGNTGKPCSTWRFISMTCRKAAAAFTPGWTTLLLFLAITKISWVPVIITC